MAARIGMVVLLMIVVFVVEGIKELIKKNRK